MFRGVLWGKADAIQKGGLKSLGMDTALFPERPDPRASPWLMGWQGEGVFKSKSECGVLLRIP